MNEPEDFSLGAELLALRARLEMLERDHGQALAALRKEFSALETRAKAAPPAAETELTAPVRPPPLPPEVRVDVVEMAPVAEPPLPAERPVAVQMAAFEQPPAPPPLPEGEGFEQQLGRVWLVRLGIALLVTGLVLLGNYAYQNWVRELPNGARLAALFGCAAVLIETGRRLAARPKLKNFGEVVLGGGLAFGYYCTFAAHHVDRLRVVESPVAAALLLFLAAATIGGVSWLRQARTTAVMAFVLASYSTMLQPIGWLSCVSSVLLAAGGVAMMLRPGWAGPGVASMLGTYAAFFGWQFLGGSQGSLQDPAVLWFLSPVWVLFALPGATGRFDVSLTERARSWFTGSNNIAFYLLFSLVWRERFDEEGYWMVPAVFGLGLAVIGIAGRRIERATGGVNLAHGLAGLSLALVLKLEGFHLALALAGQSLGLASAFARFRGRSEGFFSVVAGVGACALVAWAAAEPDHAAEIPVWSAGLAALLAAAASLVLRRGVDGCGPELRESARIGCMVVFFAAVGAGVFGWCLRLPGEWPLPAAAAIAAGLGAGFVFLDPSRRMPEVAAGAILFLIAAAFFLVETEAPAAIAAAGLLALGGTWVWHRLTGIPEEDAGFGVFAWLHSAFVAVAAGLFVVRSDWESGEISFGLSLAGLVLTGAGLALRSHRLLPCVAVLALAGAVFALVEEAGWGWAFGIAISGLAAVGLLRLPWSRPRCGGLGAAAEGILRTAVFMAICLGWQRFSPGYWGDWLAGTALLLTLATLAAKRRLPLEVTGFLWAGCLWLVGQMATSPWWPVPDFASWRGWLVTLGVLAVPPLMRRDPAAETGRYGNFASYTATALGCALASLWATQMLVWRFDWNAAAVLWSLLGFVAVSAGLWLRQVVFRQVGFVLLALAILRVFAVDVWEFTAFMRVVSFIVLGAALTLLGLFYNRFVPAMKRLLDEEKIADGGPP